MVKIRKYIGFCAYRRSCLLWSPVKYYEWPTRSALTVLFLAASKDVKRLEPKHENMLQAEDGAGRTIYSVHDSLDRSLCVNSACPPGTKHVFLRVFVLLCRAEKVYSFFVLTKPEL